MIVISEQLFLIALALVSCLIIVLLNTGAIRSCVTYIFNIFKDGVIWSWRPLLTVLLLVIVQGIAIKYVHNGHAVSLWVNNTSDGRPHGCSLWMVLGNLPFLVAILIIIVEAGPPRKPSK